MPDTPTGFDSEANSFGNELSGFIDDLELIQFGMLSSLQECLHGPFPTQ